jgi:hypothetical protein
LISRLIRAISWSHVALFVFHVEDVVDGPVEMVAA